MEYLWEMGRKTAKLFRMDNGGYVQDSEKGTELKLVDASSDTRSAGFKNKSRQSPSNSDRSSQESSSATLPTRSQSPTGSKQVNFKYGSSNIKPGNVVGSAGGGSGGGAQPPEDPGPSSSCRPEVCQRARERYTAPDLRGSPWHRSKTIFLLSTIGALVVWAIIYGTLSKLDVL